MLVQKAQTANLRVLKEQCTGVRYLVLLNLPHFDIICFHTIDPMHNIFLGIAKHTAKVWKESKVLKTINFETLQKGVDSLNPPPNIGRIPRKIESGFSTFIADQWKHWILIYSLYALYGVIPQRQFKCWSLFVDACKLLCQMCQTKAQVIKAHSLLCFAFFLLCSQSWNCQLLSST